MKLNPSWVIMVLYCASQTAVVLLLKLADLQPRAYWAYFAGANVLTAVGLWLFSLALRHLNPSIVTAMGLGGTFVASQLLLAALFGSRLTALQTGGVSLIFVGLLTLALAPSVRTL